MAIGGWTILRDTACVHTIHHSPTVLVYSYTASNIHVHVELKGHRSRSDYVLLVYRVLIVSGMVAWQLMGVARYQYATVYLLCSD